MATNQPKLGAEHKELVAIGASVGAGCHPCLSYHLKAGAKAQLADARLLAAVTSAERVAAEAAEHMVAHARGQLGAAAAAPAAAAPLDGELAAFGAALGANDLANIERHMLGAVALGVSRAQLQEAIEVALKVQQNATRIHRREAERLLERLAPAVAVAVDQGEDKDEDDCGCQADDDAQARPAASETATRPADEAGAAPAGGTAGQAGDRIASVVGAMAGHLASPGTGGPAGRLAAMADCCRAMFEMGTSPPPTSPRPEGEAVVARQR